MTAHGEAVRDASATVVPDQDDGDGGRGGRGELGFEGRQEGVPDGEFVRVVDGWTAAVAGLVGNEERGVFGEKGYEETPPNGSLVSCI